jgi:hypothetical protein
MQRAVCGFFFNPGSTSVVLIPNLTWLIPMAIDDQLHECRCAWRCV